MANFFTVSCKLTLSVVQQKKVKDTLSLASAVCTFINDQVDPSIRNKLALQSRIYHEVRKFEPRLPADLVVAALGRVAESRKSAHERRRRVRQFRPTSVALNTKAFQIREADWTVSINLVGGREKVIPLAIGEYQRARLRGQKPASAVLVSRRNGEVYLQVHVARSVPEPLPTRNVLGVAIGMETVAVTSREKSFFEGGIEGIRSQYRTVRRSLQEKASKGTRTSRRNCRRVLKRLSGRERRFATWVNHIVSKQLVADAFATQSGIVIEDLTGIRERKNREIKAKDKRAQINAWAFYQLRQFIEYKAAIVGISVVTVKPDQEVEGSATCATAEKIRSRGVARKSA